MVRNTATTRMFIEESLIHCSKCQILRMGGRNLSLSYCAIFMRKHASLLKNNILETTLISRTWVVKTPKHNTICLCNFLASKMLAVLMDACLLTNPNESIFFRPRKLRHLFGLKAALFGWVLLMTTRSADGLAWRNVLQGKVYFVSPGPDGISTV